MKRSDADGRPATPETRESSDDEEVNVGEQPATASRRAMKTPAEKRPGRQALEESDGRDADERSARMRVCQPVYSSAMHANDASDGEDSAA